MCSKRVPQTQTPYKGLLIHVSFFVLCCCVVSRHISSTIAVKHFSYNSGLCTEFAGDVKVKCK